MKISAALILCAGFGKRLNPLTLEVPKPLLELNKTTMLENSINLIENLGIKEIFINTFHLRDQIQDFIKKKKFKCNIQIIDDGEDILDTGGGILNLINHAKANDFFVFNPDTLWNNLNLVEIKKMEKLYFSKSLENILLLVNKRLSFDKELVGDFNLNPQNNLISKNNENQFIYTGCQILNKRLFVNLKVQKFSISKIWNILLENKRLYGYESLNKFYHLTNLRTFNRLKDL